MVRSFACTFARCNVVRSYVCVCGVVVVVVVVVGARVRSFVATFCRSSGCNVRVCTYVGAVVGLSRFARGNVVGCWFGRGLVAVVGSLFLLASFLAD